MEKVVRVVRKIIYIEYIQITVPVKVARDRKAGVSSAAKPGLIRGLYACGRVRVLAGIGEEQICRTGAETPEFRGSGDKKVGPGVLVQVGDGAGQTAVLLPSIISENLRSKRVTPDLPLFRYRASTSCALVMYRSGYPSPLKSPQDWLWPNFA